MSEDIASEPFEEASSRVEEAHRKSVAELKEKVAAAKAEALKKIAS